MLNASKKTPLEVISDHLVMAVAGIAHNPGLESLVIEYLGILQESKMTWEEKLEVAERHRETPAILRAVGLTCLAEWAEEVLSMESGQLKVAKAA